MEMIGKFDDGNIVVWFKATGVLTTSGDGREWFEMDNYEVTDMEMFGVGVDYKYLPVKLQEAVDDLAYEVDFQVEDSW